VGIVKLEIVQVKHLDYFVVAIGYLKTINTSFVNLSFSLTILFCSSIDLQKELYLIDAYELPFYLCNDCLVA